MRSIAALTMVALLGLSVEAPCAKADAGGAGSALAQSLHRRTGIVRGIDRSFADDGGPFLARGATLFWALWGYEHDRARLAQNLTVLREWGFDYVRVLGVVGAPGDRPDDSWRDRRLDPHSASYARNIAEMTDWVYHEHGLRVQWTIFGGIESTPTADARRAVVDRFAGMSTGREQAIFAFEIANEGFKNGFGGAEGRRELHALAKVLKSRAGNLVALTAPGDSGCAAAQALYSGSPADLMTLHLPRAGLKDGEFWKAMRHAWNMRACSGVPALASSNEPIGPQSSVDSVDDPVALTAMAAVTYGSGIGAFVLHTGPGVRGGGQADLVLGRASNVSELRTAPAIAKGLKTLAALLPADFASWKKHDTADAPLGTADQSALSDLYCSSKSAEFVCSLVGMPGPVTLTARRAMAMTVHQLFDGRTVAERRLESGGELSLPAAPPAVLVRGRLERPGH
jgi:hypothetical protein